MAETWIDAPECAAALHCSRRQLDAYKTEGILKPGIHFYGVGTQPRSCGKHIYCLERCREALLAHTQKLAEERQQLVANAVTYDEQHLAQLTKGAGANA